MDAIMGGSESWELELLKISNAGKKSNWLGDGEALLGRVRAVNVGAAWRGLAKLTGGICALVAESY